MTEPYNVLASADRTLNLVVIYNPLDLTQRDEAQLAWCHDRTLADYLDGLPEHVDWAVTLNGEVIDEECWAATAPLPDDYLTVMPTPRGGGGGGKSIVRMVAMIAVAVVSAGVGAWAAGAYAASAGVAATSTAAVMVGAAASAATMMVGSMLVNAILPPPDPKTPDADVRATKDSPTYGVDGAKNTAKSGVVLPVIYGTHRYAGNIVNMHTVNQGDTQDFYVQTVLSEGEIEDVSDIEINDQPIDNFQDVEWKWRAGTEDQTPIGWFDETIVPVNKGITLNTDWLYHETDGEVDKLRLDFVTPGGIQGINGSTGDTYGVTVPIEVQYRKKGATTWTPYGDATWADLDLAWKNAPVAMAKNAIDKVRLDLRHVFGDIDATSPAWLRPQIDLSEQTCNIEYRKVGEETWQPLDAVTVSYTGQTRIYYDTVEYSPWGGEFGTRTYRQARQEWYATKSVTYDLPSREVYEFRVVNSTTGSGTSFSAAKGVWYPLFEISGAQSSPLRKSLTLDALEEGVYEIAVRRSSAESESRYVTDAVALADVNEIVTETVAYIHTALLGVKIRLTEQLGARPNITALVRGRKLAHYDENGNVTRVAWTDNPAWIIVDILTAHYGGGMSLSRIDFAAAVELAEHCEEQGIRFNAVIDYDTNVWDVLQRALRVANAQIIRVGTRYTFIIDRADAPMMLFSVANMVEGSFKIDWLPMEDRANEIEVRYYDQSDGYRQAVVRITDPDFIDDGRPRRVATMDMFGVTGQPQAIIEGWRQLARNKFILQTVSFEAFLEAIACTVGDVVLVQHDMPRWGEAGRLAAGSTTDTLKLDKPVELDPASGDTYKVLVHQSAVKRATSTIHAVYDNTIHLTDMPTSKRVRRLKWAGGDRQILDVTDLGERMEIVLEDGSGLAVGDTVELWDTDVFEERYVDSLASSETELRLSTPLDLAPSPDANWMFGPNEKVAKPFRVIGMSGDGDYTRQLTLVEYNESIYDDPENAEAAPNYSLLPDRVKPVENLQLAESLRVMNNQIRTFVQVSWTAPDDGLYGGAHVYVSENGGPWRTIATTEPEVSVHEFEAMDGVHLRVAVRSIEAGGMPGPWSEAPQASLDVAGKIAPPATPAGFKVERVRTGVRLSWKAVEDLDLRGYEIRRGLSWDGGEVVVEETRSTSHDTLNVEAGENNYFLRAIDTGGRYSEIATATLTVSGPPAVTGFTARRSLSHIYFLWDEINDGTVVGYEIREGLTWSASVPIAKTDANSHSIPHDTTGPRTFWIKAYDNLGITGPGAFAIANVPIDQTRNVVLEKDEKGAGWPGFKMHTADSGGTLVLDAGRARGEYVLEVDLGVRLTSRVVSYAAIEAVLSSDTWGQATYTWSENQARTPWERDGDVESVSAYAEIATDVETLPTALVDAWRFNDTLASINGATTHDIAATSFAPARFANGLKIGDFSKARIYQSVPEQFHVRFWTRIADIDRTCRVLEIGSAGELRLKYRHGDRTFVLEGSDGVTLVTEPLLFPADGPLLVVLAQTASERRLIVGDAEREVFVTTAAEVSPIGALDVIDFAA